MSGILRRHEWTVVVNELVGAANQRGWCALGPATSCKELAEGQAAAVGGILIRDRRTPLVSLMGGVVGIFITSSSSYILPAQSLHKIASTIIAQKQQAYPGSWQGL